MAPPAMAESRTATCIDVAEASPRLTHHRLEDMVGGWFVGDFAPAALRCSGAEVAVKHLPRGSSEESHEHRIATEITVVVAGTVRIGGLEWTAGDIIVVPPHCAVSFKALSSTTLVVFKTPSVVGDKYPAKPGGPISMLQVQTMDT